MKTAKFTAGNWTVSEQRKVLAGSGFVICQTHKDSDDRNGISRTESEANAQLIAAAPELYEVCLSILNDDILNGILKGSDRIKLKSALNKATL